ncbi:MAG: flagellar basal body rod protein FlgC [Acidimicrobiales bacterium]|jgi:flagellar basal-body rod protein FlgC|nr:flagellar basal-body rod protein FlgC [Actinomycetota bacterium]
MSMFGALPIAGSGMEVAQTWIDAAGGNIANMNDVAPGNLPAAYREQSVVAAPAPAQGGVGQGAAVAGVLLGPSNGKLAYDPTNPLADAQGYVKYPAVNLAQQMVDLIMAQTSYQANAAVIARAKSVYQSALTLGS